MNSNIHLVTVLMPVYNGEKYIGEAIESILSQTHQNYELLIIDDYSNDNSVQIIQSFSSEKIKLIQNDRNLGQSATLNKGLKLSTGVYIARLDQDDLASHRRLEKQVDYLSKYECSVLGTWAHKINSNSEVIGCIQHPTTQKSICNALGTEPSVSHSSVMMKKEDILSIGGYSEKFKIAMDWHLWVRVIKNGYKINNISDCLTSVRFHDLQTTQSEKAQKALIHERLIILNDSKSLINSKANYNANLGWIYYYEFLLSIQDIVNGYGYKKFILKIFRIKGLIEFLKLIVYHKVFKKSNYFYDSTIVRPEK